MKPLWSQTLAWIAAALAAFLLALGQPDDGAFGDLISSHGASTPR